MAIQDTDAERRNLMVSSLGFIIYYLADGKFINNEIRIQLVNLTFGNPHILAIFSWIMLFWFLLRYWQTHKTKASTALSSDIGNVLFTNLRYFLELYTTHKIKLPHEENNGYIFDNTSISLLVWNVNYTIVKSIDSRDENGRPKSYQPIKENTLRITGIFGVTIMAVSFIAACIKNQGFTSYIVPYILFILAITIPAIQYIFV